MPYPVYLLRQRFHTLSPALFSADSHDWIVIAIEQAAIGGSSSSPIAEVIRPGTAAPAPERQSLTYSELLDVIIKGGKVITL